jgi:hypothetical protein
VRAQKQEEFRADILTQITQKEARRRLMHDFKQQ